MTSTATIIHSTSSSVSTPGPGAYSIPTVFGEKSPKITIKNRYNSRDVESSPGYEAIIAGIGTGKAYSIGHRPKEDKKESTPGPLFHPPPFGSDSPKLSMHFRAPQKKSNDSTPGPSDYVDPNFFNPLKKAKSFTIKSRVFPRDGDESCSPGPAAFNPDYSRVLKTPRTATISPRYSFSKKEITPGPSQYEVLHVFDQKPLSFHHHGYIPNSDSTPGPAAYVPERVFAVNAPKLTIRPRLENKKQITGAPYHYMPNSFGNESPKYSMSSRTKTRDIELSPGPNYMPPRFGDQSPKFSFRSRPVDKKIESSSPGPEFVPHEPKGRSITIKNRIFPPDDGRVDGPGPGKYAPDYKVVLPNSPQVTIRSVFTSRNKVQSGPGFVAAPPSNTGPMYTIGRKDNHDVIPGTG